MNRSLALLPELLAQLAVLALLHLQHLLELLRHHVVVHPAVHHVFAEVAVRWQWVLLVQRHVVQLLVGLEELLVVEEDRPSPPAGHLAHVAQGFAGWAALRNGHQSPRIVLLRREEVPQVLGTVFLQNALEVIRQSLLSDQVVPASTEERSLLRKRIVGHVQEESFIDAPKVGYLSAWLLLSTKHNLRSP